MKRIDVKNREHIKQLLYAGSVLGIKNDEFSSFGGFQLWWYDKQRASCNCCQSHWSDRRKKLVHYSLDKAAKILWHRRRSLYVRRQHAPEDQTLEIIEHLEHV